MEKYYFTYGSNHKDILGNSLGYSYTKIYAESFEEARNTMLSLRGDKWVFQYEEEEDFGKGRFGLEEAYPEDVCIDFQSEDNDVD